MACEIRAAVNELHGEAVVSQRKASGASVPLNAWCMLCLLPWRPRSSSGKPAQSCGVSLTDQSCRVSLSALSCGVSLTDQSCGVSLTDQSCGVSLTDPTRQQASWLRITTWRMRLPREGDRVHSSKLPGPFTTVFWRHLMTATHAHGGHGHGWMNRLEWALLVSPQPMRVMYARTFVWIQVCGFRCGSMCVDLCGSVCGPRCG